MGNDTGDPQPGFDHWEGFKGQGEYWNPRINMNGEWVQYKDSTYVTDLITMHAIQYMKDQPRDKPFLYTYPIRESTIISALQSDTGDRMPMKNWFCLPSFNTPEYGITALSQYRPGHR